MLGLKHTLSYVVISKNIISDVFEMSALGDIQFL